MVTLPEARGPDGLRLYAISDIHGCLDALSALERAILADLSARPAEAWRLLLLGDYVDRGTDSAGVLSWVAERVADGHLHALLGNHDAMMRGFLADPNVGSLPTWLANGGVATLASYGLPAPSAAALSSPEGRARLHASLAAAVPDVHRELLGDLGLSRRFGDYLFVHAGIRPGRPLEAQEADDLLWIRGPFLASQEDHGAVVVHGHTPVREIDIRLNRIAIDTGAVFGGPLSCLVIEGERLGMLGPEGHRDLRPARLRADGDARDT